MVSSRRSIFAMMRAFNASVAIQAFCAPCPGARRSPSDRPPSTHNPRARRCWTRMPGATPASRSFIWLSRSKSRLLMGTLQDRVMSRSCLANVTVGGQKCGSSFNERTPPGTPGDGLNRKSRAPRYRRGLMGYYSRARAARCRPALGTPQPGIGGHGGALNVQYHESPGPPRRQLTAFAVPRRHDPSRSAPMLWARFLLQGMPGQAPHFADCRS
jgi:hypothetical protein